MFKSKILPTEEIKMAIGISTSCLYPKATEEALEALGKMGVKTCEIFLNTISETTPEFIKILNKIKAEYGMEIVSVHPFSSFSETYMLFGNYRRRYLDVCEFYKKCFEMTALAGAKISIIHGSRLTGKISNAEYFERFQGLVESGREFGVTVCQENVNAHYSQNPSFLREMRAALGDDFRMVFEVKQAVRAGYEPLAFAEEFKESIAHIHLSDHNAQSDCIAPSEGNFDFKKLFEIMDAANYGGNYVVELYRNGFGEESELWKSLQYLQNL